MFPGLCQSLPQGFRVLLSFGIDSILTVYLVQLIFPIAVTERVLLPLVLTDTVHCRCRIFLIIAFVHFRHLVPHFFIGCRG